MLHAATLSGSVQFEGTAPESKVVDMGADPTCKSAHSGPVYMEDVLVNENGTLKNVFVYVKEGLEGQTFEKPKEKVVLDQLGCRYTPRVFGLQVGQKLEILNTDPTLHNVHGMPKNSKEFNLGMPIKGMKLKRTFDTPEVMVKFKCDVHPWMRAYAGVLPHPFYAVTGDDGSFEIKDLPDGDYVVEVWHEKYGTKSQEISISGAATAEFSLGA